MGQNLPLNLGQILTYKMATIGPEPNFTAYKYNVLFFGGLFHVVEKLQTVCFATFSDVGTLLAAEIETYLQCS